MHARTQAHMADLRACTPLLATPPTVPFGDIAPVIDGSVPVTNAVFSERLDVSPPRHTLVLCAPRRPV